MSCKLAHYLVAAGIHPHVGAIQVQALLPCLMKSLPSPPGAIFARTHLFPHHSSLLLNLHPDFAIAKRYYKTVAGQIPISEHLASIKGVERMWYQRNRQLEMDVKEEKDKAEVIWYQRNRQLEIDAKEEKDKLYREILNYVAENERLQAAVLKALDEKLRMTGNFNVRGALERIVYQAKDRKMIPAPGGVQKGLNGLAATPEFKKILNRVVDERGLVYEQVRRRARLLYDEVSKHAHGNDTMITVRRKDFTSEECAALVTYLSLQSEWPTHLDWREERLGE